MSVDAAQPAAEWNRRNLAAVGADARKHEVVRGDVFEVLAKLAAVHRAKGDAKAADEVKGKTELDAIVAYLQVLGTAIKGKQ